MITLAEIRTEVERLAARIGASGYVLPTYGHSEDGARPHIEVDSQGFHYVVIERGLELKRLTVTELDDLLFQVFVDVTFSLACDYELANRIDSEDCRRIIFQRQIELLRRLSPAWSEREAQRHKEILRKHPFDDAVNIRVRLTVAYREQGHSPDAAWQLACERYPLPAT